MFENAFKNTTQGAIEFNISLRKEDNKNVQITFEIKDSGIGVPKDKIDTVFESYSQLQLSKIKPLGQGLGLKIVKDLSVKMGGNVTLKSEENKGSTFIVELPFEKRKTDKTKKKQCPRVLA
ncbi:MAG: ATP-binding protein [Patiriisocius sp.]|uniref:ATP-binding protein n=1 Tax=Patiriisocius sp. TaxID=2822396 RepID=UPI003EF366D5